jgi:hypothetical protein
MTEGELLVDRTVKLSEFVDELFLIQFTLENIDIATNE